MNPSIVITGVSSGIGLGICDELLSHGYRVFGSVRKQEDADRLQQQWGDNFTPLLFDVTNPEQVQSAAEQVKQALGEQPLGALINNAGLSELGPVELLPIDRYRTLFEVNVFGMIAVTQAFLPLLGARLNFDGTPGRIINISSIFGVVSAPLMSPYTGSKHAVEGITDCLRAELLDYKIPVILVGPGPVKSRIWTKNAALDTAYAAGTRYEEPMRKMLSKQDELEALGMSQLALGRIVRKIVESKRPRPVYRPCAKRLFLWTLPRLLPTRLVDWMLANDAGLLTRRR